MQALQGKNTTGRPAKSEAKNIVGPLGQIPVGRAIAITTALTAVIHIHELRYVAER